MPGLRTDEDREVGAILIDGRVATVGEWRDLLDVYFAHPGEVVTFAPTGQEQSWRR
jgi:hypothetical protein